MDSSRLGIQIGCVVTARERAEHALGLALYAVAHTAATVVGWARERGDQLEEEPE